MVWLDVNKELPAMYTKVLFTDDWGGVYKGVYGDLRKDVITSTEDKQIHSIDNVTHWMLLPKSYNRLTEEEKANG